ncbi:endo-1,3-beta-glucanase [Eremomyces bilateralis CBS 781.70]|uniref:Glucan endo-1,3-beta-D-glucosidase 1 n=1 Tax=Eremomyces bilateralis CBS 781.70 TaxID=1392243 RepID=A0A6G1G4R8_9PEZI|nr:endo-1,3-beta-glucanase [Eremomyces bilateralis CBS 781.70]KAF1813085.1 endo-1,3-beta-glucanase [Eremomyces bilateralis CBS 781.70]
MAGNIFTPVSSESPPIPSRSDHPVRRDGVFTRSAPMDDPRQIPLGSPAEYPLQTNKFYANMLLGDRSNSVWTHPYSVSWAKGRGNAKSWGISISHIERHQLALGPLKPSGAVQYFINPVGIQSMILSATELDPSSVLTTDSLTAFSVNVNLSQAGFPPLITFPLLQGMGFVTALYKSCRPLIQSSVLFRGMEPAGSLRNITSKFRAFLEDGSIWMIYLTPYGGHRESLSMVNNTTLQGRDGFGGMIQVAKLPKGASEEIYDTCAGTYAISCDLSAEVSDDNCQYHLKWTKSGLQNPLLMFALPHHASSFDRNTVMAVRNLHLQTTTKGLAVAVMSDCWTMRERLPIDIGFAPWHPAKGSITNVSPAATRTIRAVGEKEIAQDFLSQCCLDSMYFSGKGLAKFAMMLFVLRDLVECPDLVQSGLEKLKQVFAVFISNKQPNPLAYDQVWKGVISIAGMKDGPGADFGNSWYNDHHFHYGYHVYAAAMIGYLDPSWLQDLRHTSWVNMLVRDFASPVCDEYFPFSRSFDWYHGHSWAKGLFESADGKDQESTSEDAFASYALKMWGKVTGDRNLEARGNLMLAIQARSFPTYFLMESKNNIHPPQFIGNKVTGILFENKGDHATYFGSNLEYIQGIHMIPLNPTSALIRSVQFVEEEWNTYFSNGRCNQVDGGWRGILYANLALVNPKKAFEFFSQPNFDMSWIDGGASRTWYLAYCAALAGL